MITLATGSGGAASYWLTKEVFLKYLDEFILIKSEDASCIEAKQQIVISTDSYTIDPIFFNGGDIGKLSICGSCNDVCMGGGKPEFINFGFIIEEGFKIKDLEKILESTKKTLKENNLKILSLDTKVIPRLSKNEPFIFINTTALGKKLRHLSIKNIQKNDVIILSSKIGAHGAHIYLKQNNMNLSNDLKSDCASLYPLLEDILQSNLQVKSMRDATRGGLASVLNEWAIDCNLNIEVQEAEILIEDGVKGVCEILGLEPYMLANEGACIIASSKKDSKALLKALNSHPLGADARIIGEVKSNEFNGKVVLNTSFGSKRFLEFPQGELLPRIC